MGYTGKQYETVDELCADLEIEPARLLYFAENLGNHVRAKTLTKSDGRPRDIVAPQKPLRDIQRKIKQQILEKYEYPDYVYGLGVHTLKEHAARHDSSHQLVKMDLRDFFPSISHTDVYSMWVADFYCSPDVARVLTKLTTYRGHLQQGFPTSSHVAGVASRYFTEDLSKYCRTEGITFTQYVDDLNFSRSEINYRELFKTVIKSARHFGFSMKRKKTKAFSQSVGKTITGVSIYEGRSRAARQVRQKATRALKDYTANPRDIHSKRRVDGYLLYLKHLRKSDGVNYRKLIARASDSSTKPKRDTERP